MTEAMPPSSSATSSSSSAPRRVGGGLRLKGGLVIRGGTAAAAQPLTATAADSTHRPKRKQADDGPDSQPAAAVKDEAADSRPSASPSSPPASADAAPVVDGVKRTRALNAVDAANAALQALDRQTDRTATARGEERARMIQREKDRAKAAAEAATSGAASAGGLSSGSDSRRLVQQSRSYAKRGFGDESSQAATARLNAREKSRSDRYCK